MSRRHEGWPQCEDPDGPYDCLDLVDQSSLCVGCAQYKWEREVLERQMRACWAEGSPEEKLGKREYDAQLREAGRGHLVRD